MRPLFTLVHFSILAVVLVGIPFVCCLLFGNDQMLRDVLAFPPDCENWLADPRRLWQMKCPFNGWVFGFLSASVVAILFPFVRRFFKALQLENENSPRARFPFPLFGWLGLVLSGGGWILAWTRFAWFARFQRYSYLPLWGGFILLMNALCVRRTGSSPLTTRPRAYLLLFPVSSAFWWFFEYLNRYVWNWFYIGVPGISAFEYALFATLCFASVLPGVTAVAAWLGTFGAFHEKHYQGMMRVKVRSAPAIVVMTSLALAGLIGIVFIPHLAYPFLWISPLLGFVLMQILLKEPSLLDRLAQGSWGVLFRFACASLLCGLAWETWNFHSLAKWVYSVPFVHRWLVWEMPILGFAGYLPFGLECAALAAWIEASFVKTE